MVAAFVALVVCVCGRPAAAAPPTVDQWEVKENGSTSPIYIHHAAGYPWSAAMSKHVRIYQTSLTYSLGKVAKFPALVSIPDLGTIPTQNCDAHSRYGEYIAPISVLGILTSLGVEPGMFRVEIWAGTSYFPENVISTAMYEYKPPSNHLHVLARGGGPQYVPKATPFTVDSRGPVSIRYSGNTGATGRIDAGIWSANKSPSVKVTYESGEVIYANMDPSPYTGDNAAGAPTDVLATQNNLGWYLVGGIHSQGGCDLLGHNDPAPPPPDTTPPAAPTGLAGTVGESVVNLAWNANVDPDFASYQVFRNGAQVGTVAAGGPRTYQDTGLTNGQSYTYTLKAVDTAGNISASSASVLLTPVDSAAPAAPTGLVATRGDAVVGLVWAVNTEIDLASYGVYKNGVKIATVTAGPSPTYKATGLVNGCLL